MLTDLEVREMLDLAQAFDRSFGASDVVRAVRALAIERSELKSTLEASDNYRKYEVLAKANGEMIAEIKRLTRSNAELLAACKVERDALVWAVVNAPVPPLIARFDALRQAIASAEERINP